MKEKQFLLGKKTLSWIWDDTISSSAELPCNNLILYDEQGREEWNMKEAVGFDEVCTCVQKIDDHRFYFVIFIGIGFMIDADTHVILQKSITK